MMQRLDFTYDPEHLASKAPEMGAVAFRGGAHVLLLARSVWENTGQPDKLTVAIRHADDATLLAPPVEVEDHAHAEEGLGVEVVPEP